MISLAKMLKCRNNSDVCERKTFIIKLIVPIICMIYQNGRKNLINRVWIIAIIHSKDRRNIY